MNKKTLEALKPAIVLTVICIVAALVLAAVNYFAAPEIARREKEKQLASLSVVLSDAKDFEELKADGAPKTVSQVFKETTGQGYALLCTAESGYHTITFSLGVDEEGKIAGLKVTSVFFSAGDSGKESGIQNLIDSYIGQSGVENGVAVSGATKSSAAIKNAIADALGFIESLKGGA